MPTCIFILSRFTLRVDNVLFRARDTRIYHSFASAPPLVVRETRGWEAPYERVKRVNYFCLSFVPRVPGSLCFFFSGSAAERRFDATHGPKLHLQGTLRHADGGRAGGRCWHWLARARKCRAGRFAAVVVVREGEPVVYPVLRPGTVARLYWYYTLNRRSGVPVLLATVTYLVLVQLTQRTVARFWL